MEFYNPHKHNVGVYRILNIKNGNCYIGSSKNITNRYYTHVHSLRNGTNACPILQRAYNKYGENCFVFQVILCCKPEYRLFYEQELIRELNAQYNIYTNVSLSPLRKFGHSESSRRKMSLSHTGLILSTKHKQQISKGMTGRIQTDECKEKIRNKRLGTVLSNETKEKMRMAKKGKPWSEARRLAQQKRKHEQIG